MNQNIDSRIETYLELESMLNEFFKTVDYCRNNCGIQSYVRSVNKPIIMGCCSSDSFKLGLSYVSDDSIYKSFSDKRIEEFGLPRNKNSNENEFIRCGYHDETGCKLKRYKSPTCIAYVCGAYNNHLIKTFNIDFDFEPARDFLELVLKGNLDKKEINYFKDQTKEIVKIVKRGKRFPYRVDFPVIKLTV